jgi:cyclin T
LCRLRTSLCLQFKPHHIAAGAIFLAAKFLKVKLPAEGDKAWWQEFEVNPRQLEGASLLLLLFLFVLMKLQRAV